MGLIIDPEAVIVARFIVLLAFIDEMKITGSGPVSPDQIRVITEYLKDSIRCGNALIAPDYFSGKQEHPFNVEERRRVNAFEWSDAFPGILLNGGFDAIILAAFLRPSAGSGQRNIPDPHLRH
jgi:adenine-specific DNA-methyltransferase